MHYTEIKSLEHFFRVLPSTRHFEYYVFQNIDFTKLNEELNKVLFNNCLFLGCILSEGQILRLWHENDIFPEMELPFNHYPSVLYDANVLYKNYIIGNPQSYKETYDYEVYNHFLSKGRENASVKETLAQRLHDHAIMEALRDLLDLYHEKMVVAIMGGHSLSRNTKEYREIAVLSKKLCENSYLMVSGGGPGAMEATHLGAWFAGRNMTELDLAINELSVSPDYKDELWLDSALLITQKFPRDTNFVSLGIPTWFYGHEPSTPFASKIAKFFANSIREDILLTIAKGGIVFAPGSAGTLQEIFQDATQNHYKVFGYPSPMIFFGKKYWENEIPVFPFLQKLRMKGKYQNLILLSSDNDEEIINHLQNFAKQ